MLWCLKTLVLGSCSVVSDASGLSSSSPGELDALGQNHVGNSGLRLSDTVLAFPAGGPRWEKPFSPCRNDRFHEVFVGRFSP